MYIGPRGAWDAIVAAGTDWDPVIMTAIAGAESGWTTNAISVTDDYGFLQVNIRFWGELFRQFQWDNAWDNAQMAHHVWKIQGNRAWSTYNDGSYRAYLDKARAAAGGNGQTSGGSDNGPIDVGTGDWAGWDYSIRTSYTGQYLQMSARVLQDHANAINSLY